MKLLEISSKRFVKRVSATQLSRFLSGLLTGACLLGASVSANANPVTWILNNVYSTSDNSPVTGSFVYDASTNTYSNFSITTQTGAPAYGTLPVPGYVYDTTDSFVFNTSATSLSISANDNSRYIALSFASALTDVGGSVMLGSSTECENCYPVRYLWGYLSGTPAATVSAVPLPGSYALLMSGLGLLGVMVRNRKHNTLA